MLTFKDWQVSLSGFEVARRGLLLALVTAGGACTPARDGYYSGAGIEPAISGAPVGTPCLMNAWRVEFPSQAQGHWYGPNTATVCQPGASWFGGIGPWDLVAMTGFGDATTASYFGTLGVGVIGGAPDFVFSVAREGYAIFPPGYGPYGIYAAGPHLFRRTCTPNGTLTFDEIPLDTEIPFDADADKASAQTADPFPLVRCGYQPPPPDLGVVATRLFSSAASGLARPVADLAWSPESDILFVLRGVVGQPGAALYRIDRKGGDARQIRTGDLDGPLQVGAHAQTLILTELVVAPAGSDYPNQNAVTGAKRSVLGVDPSSGLYRQLSSSSWPYRRQESLLSHDGKTLAMPSPTGGTWLFVDVSSLVVTGEIATTGVPLLWRPDDGAVLTPVSPSHTLSWVTPQGEMIPTKLSASIPLKGCFQQTNSLRCVDGSTMYDAASGEALFDQSDTIGDGSHADDGARARFNDLTAQSFAWSATCLGLGETSCDAKLERYSWRTHTNDVVARASHVLPFAVSPDGHALATLDGDTVYVKELP